MQEGPLAPDRALSLLVQVGGALDAAHGRGLVRRDVKPANVMVDSGTGPEAPEIAYVADFGLIKDVQSGGRATETGEFLGTIAYVAPEQIEGRPVDGRARVLGRPGAFRARRYPVRQSSECPLPIPRPAVDSSARPFARTAQQPRNGTCTAGLSSCTCTCGCATLAAVAGVAGDEDVVKRFRLLASRGMIRAVVRGKAKERLPGRHATRRRRFPSSPPRAYSPPSGTRGSGSG